MIAPATPPLSRSPRYPRLPAVRRRDAHRRLGVVGQSAPDGHDRGMDALLTAEEVAALLRVNKACVYSETRAKHIPHVPLGRYVRYRRSAVLDWIAGLERASDRDLRVPTDWE